MRVFLTWQSNNQFSNGRLKMITKLIFMSFNYLCFFVKTKLLTSWSLWVTSHFLLCRHKIIYPMTIWLYLWTITVLQFILRTLHVCSIYFAERTFYLKLCKTLENMAIVCLNTLTVIVTLIKTLYELKLIMHHLCPFHVHLKDYLAF